MRSIFRAIATTVTRALFRRKRMWDSCVFRKNRRVFLRFLLEKKKEINKYTIVGRVCRVEPNGFSGLSIRHKQ